MDLARRDFHKFETSESDPLCCFSQRLPHDIERMLLVDSRQAEVEIC
jgi:hypothetical protein